MREMKKKYRTPSLTTIKEVPLFGLTREQEDRLLIIDPGCHMFLMPYRIAKQDSFRDRFIPLRPDNLED